MNTTRMAGRPELAERRFAVDHLHDAGAEPVGVAGAAAELVVTRDQVAVVDLGGLAHRAEHAGVDAHLGAEHGLDRLVRGVDRGEARRGGVGHGRPAGRPVGVGQLLEDLERGDRVGLEPADLGRHEHPEQLGVGEGVDDLGGHGAVQLACARRWPRSAAAGRGPARSVTGTQRGRRRSSTSPGCAEVRVMGASVAVICRS